MGSSRKSIVVAMAVSKLSWAYDRGLVIWMPEWVLRLWTERDLGCAAVIHRKEEIESARVYLCVSSGLSFTSLAQTAKQSLFAMDL